MPERTWPHDELVSSLEQFEAELRRAGLRETSVETYVDRSQRFLRWLIEDYTPRGPDP